MKILIEKIKQDSGILLDIIKLGGANSKTLGFFPKGAFTDHASKGWILGALNEQGNLMGYLLYRVVRRGMVWPKITIVHLCVDDQYRGMNVARSLMNELVDSTQEKFLRIELSCRQDYPVNQIWPKLGFQKIAEKTGRSSKGILLDIWVKEFRIPPMIALWEDLEVDPRLIAVLDANVLFRMQDNLPIDSKADTLLSEEAKSLEVGWISEDINFMKTDEIYSEVNRNPNVILRSRRIKFVNEFHSIASNPDRVDELEKELTLMFPSSNNPNTISDVRHIAHAINGGAHFFVTQDEGLLKKSIRIENSYGINILSPAVLLGQIDEKIREFEYYPVRLAGSGLQISKLPSNQIEFLYDNFRCISKGESKRKFERKIRAYISNPTKFNLTLVSGEKERLLALIAIDRSNPNEYKIPIMRVASSNLSGTLLRYLILQTVIDSAQENRDVVRFTEECQSDEIKRALGEIGFSRFKNQWVKVNIKLIDDYKKIIEKINVIGKHQKIEVLTTNLGESLELANAEQDKIALSDIERRLWPAKILDADIPTFIVTIHPHYAKSLFDEGLANQTLWGSEEKLILRNENIYYRAAHPSGGLTYPGRILWYVMNRFGYQGTKRIRACSYLDEVIIGTPKEIFRRYKRFGIYTWEDVSKITKGDVTKDMMAIRFSNTELFSNPVRLEEVKKIIKSVENKQPVLQSPQSITKQSFAQIYKIGQNL